MPYRKPNAPVVIPLFRTCTKCGIEKRITEFRARPGARMNQYRSTCKRCEHRFINQRMKARRQLGHETFHYALKSKYGVNLTEYNRLMVAQRGICAICHRPETRTWRGQTKRLAVDHDHVTGKHRALLCDACNTILARCGDDPSILIAAIDYLGKFGRVEEIILRA